MKNFTTVRTLCLSGMIVGLMLIGLSVFLSSSAEAVTVRFTSDQIASGATNTYIAVTDGTWTTWTDPATIGTDGKVKVNAADPTPHYLASTLLAGDSISLAVAGDNETMTVHAEPAGADTQIQYNNAGDFGAEAAFVYDDATNTLGILDGIFSMDNTDASRRLYITPTLFQINENGVDMDTKIGSTTQAVMLGVDAGADGIFLNGITYGPPVADGSSGEVFRTNGAGGITWEANYTDLLFGYRGTGGTTPGDEYMFIDQAEGTQFAGTGAADVLGFGLPWNVSIVGISANYELVDGAGVTTIDIFVREDGADINAACKLTIPETGPGVRDTVTVTFASGTYTSVADQTLNIYMDTTTSGIPVMTDLIVTVYYDYSI